MLVSEFCAVQLAVDKCRYTSIKVQVESFEFRVENFEFRVEDFETRNKELFARLIFSRNLSDKD